MLLFCYSFFFQPIMLETLDALASSVLDFLCELGQHLSAATHVVYETAFQFQRLYVSITSLCSPMHLLVFLTLSQTSSHHPVCFFKLSILALKMWKNINNTNLDDDFFSGHLQCTSSCDETSELSILHVCAC